MFYYQDNEIILRDICEADVTNLFSWWIDREVNKYDPRPIPSDSKELIKECINYCNSFYNEVMNENIEARKYKYFVISNYEDKPIGFVNFFSIDNEKKQGEMGVVIGDKRFWNKGIAFRAVNTVVNYIFENMDISRIYIETSHNNIPALGLFDKLGFKKCGEYIEDEFTKFVVMETIRENI